MNFLTRYNEKFLKYQAGAAPQKIYVISEHVWSYVGKMVILTRHLLNAACTNDHLISQLGKDLPERVRKKTTRLKLFSIVSVPFSLVSLKSISEKIFKSYLSQDREGVALGSLSFAITFADAFDSTTTFVNATLSLTGRAPVESFSALGIPIGFAISGMGTVSRIIQIAKACHVSRSVKAVHTQLKSIEQRAEIAAPLKNEEILKTIPGEIELKLRTLYDLITNDGDKAKISQMLDDIQDLLNKKFIMEGLGIFANALVISALRLFYSGSLSSTPFLLLSSSFFIRISSLAYQDFHESQLKE